MAVVHRVKSSISPAAGLGFSGKNRRCAVMAVVLGFFVYAVLAHATDPRPGPARGGRELLPGVQPSIAGAGYPGLTAHCHLVKGLTVVRRASPEGAADPRPLGPGCH